MNEKIFMEKRLQLYEHLPLATPLSLHVFPSFYCNLKCNYCLHSLTQDELEEMSFNRQSMSFDVYQKAIDDLLEFPQKLKALIFAGHGEPLIHQDIAKMVKYAKQKDISERIEIVTNGTLLTPELSNHLISAGLDRLRISIQGVTSEKYKTITSKSIDFEQLVQSISYFYESRQNCEVYVKIVDAALTEDNEKEQFMKTFEAISDSATIEYIIPFVNSIDYDNLGADLSKTKMGLQSGKTNICSMPFYMLVLNPDGSVLPCCSTEIPIIYRNSQQDCFLNIWNSDIRNTFLLNQLKNKDQNEVCRRCSVPMYGLQDGDYLDSNVERLLEIYKQ